MFVVLFLQVPTAPVGTKLIIFARNVLLDISCIKTQLLHLPGIIVLPSGLMLIATVIPKTL